MKTVRNFFQFTLAFVGLWMSLLALNHFCQHPQATAPRQFQDRDDEVVSLIREKLKAEPRPTWAWKSPIYADFYLVLHDGAKMEICGEGVFMKFYNGHTLEGDMWGAPKYENGRKGVSPDGKELYRKTLEGLLTKLSL